MSTALANQASQLSNLEKIIKDQGWDKAWCDGFLALLLLVELIDNYRQEKITPWDTGDLQPPLRDLLLTDEADWPREGRALVPGCGRVRSLMIRS